MAEQLYQHSGSVVLDGQTYELVRQRGSTLAYRSGMFNQYPWEGGVPPLLTRKISSWHRGGFKTFLPQERLAVNQQPQSVEQSSHGVNSDPRWPNRLMPGPEINSIDTPDNESLVTYIWQQPARDTGTTVERASIWYVSGARVYTSDNLQTAIVSFEDTSDPPVMGVNWQGENIIITQSKKIYRRGLVLQDSASPDGAGNSTDWITVTGANWTRVDDSPHDNLNTVVQGFNEDDLDLYTFANVTATDPISSLSLTAYAYGVYLDGTPGKIRFVVRIGTTNYFSDEIEIGYYTAQPQTVTYSWPLSPATGVAWTEAEVNGAQFGYVLSTAPSTEDTSVAITSITVQIYSEDWATVDALADWLAIGPRRLFKVYDDPSNGIVVKNLAPGLDPTDESNWGDNVVVPGVEIDSYVPLIPFQKTVLVATDQGTHAIDVDGTGIRVLERMPWAPKTLAIRDPYVYISHGHGITRWFPGLAESCGLENYIENQTGISGIVTALAFIGKWTFAALTPRSGNTQILVGRDADDRDLDRPVVWDTFIDTGSPAEIRYLFTTRWAGLTSSDASFGLFFGTGTNISYTLFPETGGSPEVDDPDYQFATECNRYTSRMSFGDPREKQMYKIVAKGKDLSATIKWSISYRLDGGSWVTVDRDGAAMELTSDGEETFYLPTDAVGLDIQLNLEYESDDSTAKGIVEYVEIYAIPQSQKGVVNTFFVRLGNGVFHSDSLEIRSVYEQYDALKTLARTQSPITATGPWGEEVTFTIKDVSTETVYQDSNAQPELIVQIQAQEHD